MRAVSVVVLFVCAAVALSCGGGSAETTRHDLGERARIAGWPDVVVLGLTRDVDQRDLYEPDSILRPEPLNDNEEIIVVDVRFINDEGEPFEIDPFYMFDVRSQGKDVTATFELFADVVLEDQTLPPDQEIEGKLAYKMVRGLRELELVYQPAAGDAIDDAFDDLSEGRLPTVSDIDRAIFRLEPDD